MGSCWEAAEISVQHRAVECSRLPPRSPKKSTIEAKFGRRSVGVAHNPNFESVIHRILKLLLASDVTSFFYRSSPGLVFTGRIQIDLSPSGRRFAQNHGASTSRVFYRHVWVGRRRRVTTYLIHRVGWRAYLEDGDEDTY
jgi:hypothetical protein